MDDGEATPLQTPQDEKEEAVRFAQETKYNFALPVLLANPFLENIPPVIYLKALGEGFALALGFSWILTAIFSPEIISDNPLMDRLGYNNVCVGWDVSPARLIASVVWIPVSFLGLRFCYMNYVRFELDGGFSFFDYAANFSFAVAICGFTLCLLISPFDNVYGHTVPFLFYILTRFWIVLALCLEEWESLSRGTVVFLYLYGIPSFLLPIIVLFEYAYYSEYGEKSPWPWQITFFLDYFWFGCTVVTSKFIPSSVVIYRTFELVPIQSA